MIRASVEPTDVLDAQAPDDIRPVVRPGLGAWPLGRRNGRLWCIGSLEVDRYIRVPRELYPAALALAALLDGTRTLVEAEAHITRHYAGVTAPVVRRLYHMLSVSDLLLEPPPTYIYHSETRRLSLDVLSLPLMRVGRIGATLLRPPVWWLLNLAGFAIIALAGWTLTQHPGLLSARLITVHQSFTLGLLVSLALAALVVVWHEMGHGLAALRYRLPVRSLRLALYAGVAPLVYLDIRGLYSVSLSRRIWIWLAGVWANLCGAGILFVLVTHATLPELVQQILWKLIVLNIIFVPTNLSPFMPTDGYFILCNLTGRFNLRSELLTVLRAPFSRRGAARTAHLSVFTLMYLVLSAATWVAGVAFWMWWLVQVCTELYWVAQGPTLVHWAVALMVPTVLALGILYITVRSQRLMHARMRPVTRVPPAGSAQS